MVLFNYSYKIDPVKVVKKCTPYFKGQRKVIIHLTFLRILVSNTYSFWNAPEHGVWLSLF